MSLMRKFIRWLSRKEPATRVVNEDLLGFGLQASPLDPRDATFAVQVDPAMAIPVSVDLSEWCPPVKNQGGIGSCASHAICSAMEATVAKNRGKDQVAPLSELWHYYNVRQKGYMNTFPEDSGQYIRTGMKLAANAGVAPEVLWPYKDYKYNTKPAFWADSFARFFKAVQYHRCWSVEAIRQSLAQGQFVVIGVDWFRDDLPFAIGSTSGNLRFTGNACGGHAILVTAYDHEHENPDGTKGAFKIFNSWGRVFGDEGFAWVNYNLIRKNLIEAWALEVTS